MSALPPKTYGFYQHQRCSACGSYSQVVTLHAVLGTLQNESSCGQNPRTRDSNPPATRESLKQHDGDYRICHLSQFKQQTEFCWCLFKPDLYRSKITDCIRHKPVLTLCLLSHRMTAVLTGCRFRLLLLSNRCRFGEFSQSAFFFRFKGQ